MELKMPIQIHAQARAKAPFLVAEYAENISPLVTLEIRIVMIAALMKIFQPFSFKNTRKHFPVYILICFNLDAPFIIFYPSIPNKLIALTSLHLNND